MKIARGLRLVLLLALSAVVLAAPACKKAAEPTSSLPPVSAKPKPAPVPKEAPAQVEEEQAVVYSYNPDGFRDPFGSLLRIKEEEEGIPEELLTPLQRVPVTDLRVEGIIVTAKKAYAHVIAPDGKPYIVNMGTLMGRNDGKVVRITSDEVVVEEKFKDYLGKEFKQETVLRLREKEEESL